jgi:hypothetical protein
MTRDQQILLQASRTLIDLARRFPNIAPEDADGETVAWCRYNAAVFTLEIYNNVAYIQSGGPRVLLKIDNLNKRIEFIEGGFNELLALTHHANMVVNVLGAMRGF